MAEKRVQISINRGSGSLGKTSAFGISSTRFLSVWGCGFSIRGQSPYNVYMLQGLTIVSERHEASKMAGFVGDGTRWLRKQTPGPQESDVSPRLVVLKPQNCCTVVRTGRNGEGTCGAERKCCMG